MSAVNSFATALANLILNNQAITGIGDAGGLLPSASDGNLYIALFTTDPGETGDATNEATYTSYARVSVERDPLDPEWTVTDGVAMNVNAITFPEATGGSETITHFGVMSGISGDNMIIGGELQSPLVLSAGDQPSIPTNEAILTFD